MRDYIFYLKPYWFIHIYLYIFTSGSFRRFLKGYNVFIIFLHLSALIFFLSLDALFKLIEKLVSEITNKKYIYVYYI